MSSLLHHGVVSKSSPSHTVAIIGAGAAGLAAARVFSRNGIRPVVFEKESETGGVWDYRANAKDRPMYKGLRTNLPREIMAYREKPWGSDGLGPRQVIGFCLISLILNVCFETWCDNDSFVDRLLHNSRSFVRHQDVLQYLHEYSECFGLQKFISYGCTVTQLEICKEETGPKSLIAHHHNTDDGPLCQIKINWEQQHNSDTNGNKSQVVVDKHSSLFDAVCVCNGHYATPSIPSLPGMENFKGRIMHSIEYDDPSQFVNQNILCVGGRASGADLAREISAHANKVYLSDTTCPQLPDGNPIQKGNVFWVPRTESIDDNSAISFGESCGDRPNDIDVIIFCSGYDYNFPFINERSNLTFHSVPGERRVSPLYEQLWHAEHVQLSFIGLPHSVVPFPFFELQAEAIVAQLLGSSTSSLPNTKERLAAATRDSIAGGPKPNGRIQDTHFLGDYQWDFLRNYSKLAGNYDEEMENFISTNKFIYDHAGKQRKILFPGGPDVYRNNIYRRKDKSQSFDVDKYEVDLTTPIVTSSTH